MARISTLDPLDRFRWQVDIDGFTRSGFTAVEAPSMELRTKEYPEGGDHLHPKLIIDSASYKEITLLRGVTPDSSFRNWIQIPEQIVVACQNPPSSSFFSFPGVTPPSNTPQQQIDSYRKTVTITHLDRGGNPTKKYQLFNAIPVGFTVASDFQADSDDAISMEKLVLKYESFVAISINDSLSSAFNVTNIAKRLTRNYL